jgi:hypothetical protein
MTFFKSVGSSALLHLPAMMALVALVLYQTAVFILDSLNAFVGKRNVVVVALLLALASALRAADGTYICSYQSY